MYLSRINSQEKFTREQIEFFKARKERFCSRLIKEQQKLYLLSNPYSNDNYELDFIYQGLSLLAKAVFDEFCHFHNLYGLNLWPSHKKIAAKVGCSVSQLKRIILVLENLGILVTIFRGIKKTKRYFVHPHFVAATRVFQHDELQVRIYVVNTLSLDTVSSTWKYLRRNRVPREATERIRDTRPYATNFNPGYMMTQQYPKETPNLTHNPRKMTILDVDTARTVNDRYTRNQAEEKIQAFIEGIANGTIAFKDKQQEELRIEQYRRIVYAKLNRDGP